MAKPQPILIVLLRTGTRRPAKATGCGPSRRFLEWDASFPTAGILGRGLLESDIPMAIGPSLLALLRKRPGPGSRRPLAALALVATAFVLGPLLFDLFMAIPWPIRKRLGQGLVLILVGIGCAAFDRGPGDTWPVPGEGSLRRDRTRPEWIGPGSGSPGSYNSRSLRWRFLSSVIPRAWGLATGTISSRGSRPSAA